MKRSLFLAIFAAVILPACAGPVGAKRDITPAGAATQNTAPVNLTLSRDGQTWSIDGVGPTEYVEGTGRDRNSIRTGSVPSEAIIDAREGLVQLSLNGSGGLRGMTLDPNTQTLAIEAIEVDGSQVIRAGNEAFDRLAPLWQSMSADQRAVEIAALETQAAAGSSIASVLLEVLKIIPVP